MNSIPEKTQVVVIGGGPGGATAAAILAKEGVEVVLFEKDRFPRNIVGESLIPFFWSYAKLMGAAERIRSEGFIIKAGGVAIEEDVLKSIKFSDFGFKDPSYHVERDVFDKILLDQAQENGAKVYQESKVVEVQLDEKVVVTEVNGERYRTQYEYLIDATGQSGLVSKQMKSRSFDEDFKFQSVWGYFGASDYLTPDFKVTPFAERASKPPATIVHHLKDWGWIWHIVMREKVSIGLILPRANMTKFKELGETLEEQFVGALSSTEVISRLVDLNSFIPGSVRSIRDYAYETNELVIDDCFLVGDAAGFVDPINSAGVPFAMYAAATSAWAIRNSLDNPARTDFYKAIYEKHYRSRLDLFKVSAYPSDELIEDVEERYKDIFDFNSQTDIDLIATQVAFSNRRENLEHVMEKKGIHFNQLVSEMSIDELKSQFD